MTLVLPIQDLSILVCTQFFERNIITLVTFEILVIENFECVLARLRSILDNHIALTVV